MRERFDIHNAALGLARHAGGGGFELFGVLAQKFVGHLGNRALRFQRGLRMVHAQGEHHLALPQRDGVHD